VADRNKVPLAQYLDQRPLKTVCSTSLSACRAFELVQIKGG
jgi:hypothetical protein